MRQQGPLEAFVFIWSKSRTVVQTSNYDNLAFALGLSRRRRRRCRIRISTLEPRTGAPRVGCEVSGFQYRRIFAARSTLRKRRCASDATQGTSDGIADPLAGSIGASWTNVSNCTVLVGIAGVKKAGPSASSTEKATHLQLLYAPSRHWVSRAHGLYIW